MSYFYTKNINKKERIRMLDQNTDRGSWAMIALVVAGVALLLVKAGSNEIGQLILDNIKALFTS